MDNDIDFEWKQLDASNFDSIEATEAWGAFALGILMIIVAKETADEEDLEPDEADAQPYSWNVYAVGRQEIEGFGGLEHIDGYESLAQARDSIDASRLELIQIAREIRS